MTCVAVTQTMIVLGINYTRRYNTANYSVWYQHYVSLLRRVITSGIDTTCGLILHNYGVWLVVVVLVVVVAAAAAAAAVVVVVTIIVGS